MPGSLPREYNQIYEALVYEPNDIVGLIAYGIYKREKIDHIKRFVDREGRNPTDEDLRAFHEESMARVENYRKLASIEVQSLYNHIAAEQAEVMFKQLAGSLDSTLKELRPKWSTGVWQGAVGNVVFTVGLFLVLMLVIGFFDGAPAIIQNLVRWLGKLSPSG